MLSTFKVALVLGAHTDDCEFGCGGTIARLREAGVVVHHVVFSRCVESLPDGAPPETLVLEAQDAAKILDTELYIEDHPVRRLPSLRQEILEYLVEFQRRVEPQLVLMPSVRDIHQDHKTVAEEGVRAFQRHANVWSYEIFWNTPEFSCDLFVSLHRRHLNKKLRAIACYESQKDRYYAKPDLIEAQARMRGTQIGVPYAETFEVVRGIVR